MRPLLVHPLVALAFGTALVAGPAVSGWLSYRTALAELDRALELRPPVAVVDYEPITARLAQGTPARDLEPAFATLKGHSSRLRAHGYLVLNKASVDAVPAPFLVSAEPHCRAGLAAGPRCSIAARRQRGAGDQQERSPGPDRGADRTAGQPAMTALPVLAATRARLRSTLAAFSDPAHRRKVARFCFVTAAPAAAGRLRRRPLRHRHRPADRPLPARCARRADRPLATARRPPATLVVFAARGLAPAFADGTLLVKRLAGLPGDLVEISTAGVHVNGRLVAAGLALAGQLGHAPTDFQRSYRVPEGRFLALGTHEQSLDGRYYGPVPDAQIRGSASVLF